MHLLKKGTVTVPPTQVFQELQMLRSSDAELFPSAPYMKAPSPQCLSTDSLAVWKNSSFCRPGCFHWHWTWVPWHPETWGRSKHCSPTPLHLPYATTNVVPQEHRDVGIQGIWGSVGLSQGTIWTRWRLTPNSRQDGFIQGLTVTACYFRIEGKKNS